MNRKNLLLRAFGAVVVVFIFVLFIVQGWSFVKWNTGKPLTTLEPQGPLSESIQSLVSPVFIIAALVFFAVLGAVLFIGFKFRDRGDIETADEIPHQLHGKTFLEIGWTILPAVVLLIVGLGTVVTLNAMNAPPKANALHVKVTGQQWWWAFTYDVDGNGSFTDPDDFSTPNEMIIPTGREVALTETSNDVIHSFWIPALNGKKDAVPGMTTDWKVQANEPGVYRGQCTEFCGLSHANMRMVVRAVSPNDFDTWFANQRRPGAKPPAGTEAAAGREVFLNQLCSSCHLVRGENEEKVFGEEGVASLLVPKVAPDLTHFASRGTFAGAIFNRTFPNPGGSDLVPFGQTCKARGREGSGTSGLGGERIDAESLPECEKSDLPDAKLIPWSAAPGNPDNPTANGALEAWLRDPPGVKPMAAEPEENPHAGELRRGMPNLQLSEDQIEQLVAYLNSLK